MKKSLYIALILFGIVLIPQIAVAQVDFNKTPDDDLGNVEDQFQELFFEALKQKGIENYDRAVDALLKCVKLDDSRPVVYYELGKNYNLLKNFGEAEDALKKAIDMQPENEWFLDELYHVYVQQDDMDRAIKTVKQLVKYHPDYKQDLATLYFKEKKYKQALSLLDELDASYGITDSRDYLRNQIYNATGKSKDRIENLEDRVASDPNNELNQLKLIYRYSEAGNKKKAFKAAKELLEHKPESKLVHLALYKFYLEDDDAKAAVESMKVVFTTDEINAEAKAKVLKDFVNYVKANPEYEKDLVEITTLADNTNDPKTLENLGQYYLKSGDKAKALKNFEEALLQKPNDFALLKNILLLQVDLGNNEDVVKRSNEAIELYPAQPLLYLVNGVAQNKLNQSDKAIEMLETGLDFIIDDIKMEADFYQQLSLAYKQNNNNAKSQAFAKKAENLLKTQQ
ncbi:tetratricopeptide repeat protein [Winogradskyella sp. 3972H.M.0a.05]|uniref:tetratricopeptide repeat protein n=1 Tax=Winogradskyella sp. 3972H.M.0a.05 TaxID=2950277 RepID=UPI0033940628